MSAQITVASQDVPKERFNRRSAVFSQIRTIWSLPSIHSKSATDLRELLNTVNGCVTALEQCEVSAAELLDCWMVFLASTKLPREILMLWEESLADPTEIPSWEAMSEFLLRRSLTLEMIELYNPSSSKQANAKITVNERIDYIKQKMLCLNCFARGHELRDCPCPYDCFTCLGRHHTLLHQDNTPPIV
ncbi:uncharacterized protein LOC108155793 isoform X3 [Drosophila miranda]|uniref:uncharacterized protein LOC108155793 isoform X3 n=1 Tax=Drosophila miranda TaxID=7229 RepID=UPI0007E8187F|nr:uncharacterized protein LOC108155793 isoform X3 [Drosophila miranda]